MFPDPNTGVDTESWRQNWNSGKAVQAGCTTGFGLDGKETIGRSRVCSPEALGHVKNEPFEVARLAVACLGGVVGGLSESAQDAHLTA